MSRDDFLERLEELYRQHDGGDISGTLYKARVIETVYEYFSQFD